MKELVFILSRRSFWVWAQPRRDDVTMWCRLSLAEPVHHSGHGFSQWETTLQCNVPSYWLNPCQKWLMPMIFLQISLLCYLEKIHMYYRVSINGGWYITTWHRQQYATTGRWDRNYDTLKLEETWLFAGDNISGHFTRASCQIRTIAGAHALGMAGKFSPPPRVSDPDMHHGPCMTHVPWCMPGSLTSCFFWSRRWVKTFPAFPAHVQPAIYVSGKRPMDT